MDIILDWVDSEKIRSSAEALISTSSQFGFIEEKDAFVGFVDSSPLKQDAKNSLNAFSHTKAKESQTESKVQSAKKMMAEASEIANRRQLLKSHKIKEKDKSDWICEEVDSSFSQLIHFLEKNFSSFGFLLLDSNKKTASHFQGKDLFSFILKSNLVEKFEANYSYEFLLGAEKYCRIFSYESSKGFLIVAITTSQCLSNENFNCIREFLPF